jgi:crotonobetainyl-CoA:carnitine CoA-transferase CaiB-like acyl-CoA transferase
MVSLSAMGQTGPWKNFVALAPTLQALSGLTYLTSFNEHSPMGLGFAYADVVAGLYAVLAVLAALEYRDKKDKGQYIDLSEYEALCATMGPAFLEAAIHPVAMLPKGNRPDYILAAPYGCYQCTGEDRWCVIAVHTEEEWQGLCKAMGSPDWTKEERFSKPSRRKILSEELDELLGSWTIQHPAEEVAALLQKNGVPAGVVQNAGDLAKDPQLIARRFFVNLEHPVLGQTITDAPPIHFEREPAVDWKACPLLGEDNRYVFTELLGFTENELSDYMKRGIIR